MTEKSDIDSDLFPPPSGSLCPFGPRTWPGVSPSSTTTLQSILSDNHEWQPGHVYYNDQRIHNNVAHTVLALWRLGANKSILESAYKFRCGHQTPATPSPNSIDRENWQFHLGDERYYQAYRNFFEAEVRVKSFGTILEEYIFQSIRKERLVFSTGIGKGPGTADSEVQVETLPGTSESATKTSPRMLARFFAGILHPLNHIGLGVENHLPGTFAEGLAQTAIMDISPQSTQSVPSPGFLQDDAGLIFRFAKGVHLENAKTGTHAFTVLARILADPRFEGRHENESTMYTDTLRKHGEVIRDYVDQWDLTGDIHKKLEELLWMYVLIYGVGGSESSGEFNADFFHMHFVTSSLFLPSFLPLLSRDSQEQLLSCHFTACMVWYIARGRAELDIARFFGNSSTVHPVPPGPMPTPHANVFPSPTSPHAMTPDPWLPIIQSTLTHPDGYLPQLQRALAEFSSHFSSKPAGYFRGTELKDAELIDGTLFVRVAGLTTGRLGWVREGESPSGAFRPWDRRGFYEAADKV